MTMNNYIDIGIHEISKKLFEKLWNEEIQYPITTESDILQYNLEIPRKKNQDTSEDIAITFPKTAVISSELTRNKNEENIVILYCNNIVNWMQS